MVMATAGLGRAVSAASLWEYISGLGIATADVAAPARLINGRWMARGVSYRGFLRDGFDEEFEFTVDNGELTGTASFLEAKRRILQGKVKDNRLSFDLPSAYGEADKPGWTYYTIHYFGVLKGREIHFQVQDRTKLHEFVATKEENTGWLGVKTESLSTELAKSSGLKDTDGVLIADIFADSPAAEAGLLPGDILLAFDGKKMTSPVVLRRAIGLTAPGVTVKLTILRQRSEHSIEAKIGEMSGQRSLRPLPLWTRSGGRSMPAIHSCSSSAPIPAGPPPAAASSRTPSAAASA
jgi:hypothetical protein